MKYRLHKYYDFAGKTWSEDTGHVLDLPHDLTPHLIGEVVEKMISIGYLQDLAEYTEGGHCSDILRLDIDGDVIQICHVDTGEEFFQLIKL